MGIFGCSWCNLLVSNIPPRLKDCIAQIFNVTLLSGLVEREKIETDSVCERERGRED